jgi:hypothetical protein
MASDSVAGQFLRNALLWFVPALLLLPIYVLLVAISVVAGDGAVLDFVGKLRGRIDGALGLLMIVGGVALGVVLPSLATDGQSWAYGGFTALVLLGMGVYFVRRELKRLAEAKRT